MANGITLQMRAIKKPEPEWVHQHFVPELKLASLAAAKRAADLQPYINLARDQKRGRNPKSRRLTSKALWAALEVAFTEPEAA